MEHATHQHGHEMSEHPVSMADQAVGVLDHAAGHTTSLIHHAHGAMDMTMGYPLIIGLFMVGMIGGASHCTAMCGPFVLAQTAARLEGIPASAMSEWRRLTGAALLPYHLGRGITYIFLGATAGLLAATAVQALPWMRWVPAALMVLAAFMLFGAAFPRLMPSLTGLVPFIKPAKKNALPSKTPSAQTPRRQLLAYFFKNPVGWRGLGLGILLGFLPCGFVYGAISAAAASGSFLTATAGMAAFTAGTSLPLIVTALVGHMAGSQMRGIAARIAPWLLTFNAVLLLGMAWKAAS